MSSELKRPLFGAEIEPIKLKKKMSVEDLVEAFHGMGAYNAGRLAKACELYEKMVRDEDDTTIAMSLAGALTPTGLGGAVIYLMRNGLVDFLISTGANLYHDIHFALGLPVYQGSFHVDDRELLKEDIVRIYDIFITEKAILETDKFIREAFSSNRFEGPISTAEVHHALGRTILKKARFPEKSLVAQAAKHDVPIYTPSPGDSSIGMNLAYFKLRGKGVIVDTDLDVIETAAIVYGSRKNGCIVLGGGAPKNFYLQTQPMLSQIMGISKSRTWAYTKKGGHNYVIQISVDPPYYGGLSGATPSEAVSWGKVNPSQLNNCAVVYADSTIAAPILFAYILSTGLKRRPKKLYSKRGELVERLRQACLSR